MVLMVIVSLSHVFIIFADVHLFFGIWELSWDS